MSQGGSVYVLHIDGVIGTNRTVYTIVGILKDLQKRLEDLIEMLSHNLDINKHSGIHPHIGVLDVIPFIPLANISFQELEKETIRWSHEMSKKFDLPVFFYGPIAAERAKRALHFFRKGGLDNLKVRMKEGLMPDAGPARLHSSLGASCVTVRNFMGAFNVNLDTQDLVHAKRLVDHILNIRRDQSKADHFKIANVKFLAWFIPEYNRCQISTNMYRLDELTLLQLYDFISRQADKFDLKVIGSELIGMIPEAGLRHESLSVTEVLNQLKLDSVRPFDLQKQVLEYQLKNITFADSDHSEEVV